MHEVVAGLARDWGLTCTVLPMTNEPVQTMITGPDGELAFQEYMVKLDGAGCPLDPVRRHRSSEAGAGYLSRWRTPRW